MVDSLGYTTHLRNIPIEVFLDMIEGDIKKLIRKYGHKNCGLMHEELCEKIQTTVTTKKTHIFKHMDEYGQQKLNREWRSKKNEFFKKLFEEEEFINVCYPLKEKGNQNLQKLKLKHIEFCKEKDLRRSTIGNNPEYSVCRQYNVWIETEKASFTREFLKIVSKSNIQTVKKYFITKKHPGGHDPLLTYRNSKLDCSKYKSPSSSHPQIPLQKAHPDNLHLPTAPAVRKESQGIGGKSIPGGERGTEKEKSDAKILPKTEPAASDSLISPVSKTKVHGTPNGKRTDLNAKGTGPPVNAQAPTVKPTEATDTQAQSHEQLPEPTISISHTDSSAAKVLNPPASVIIGKDTGVTASTTSDTSGATHSTENVQSSLSSDLSLVQSQPQLPPVDLGTANNSKEPTPDPAIKSPDSDIPPTTALDPGLASVPEAASNSSASGTSSTMVSTTTDSTAGSPPAHDSLLITVPSQSTTTAVSVIGTQPVSIVTGNAITTKESENSKAPIKTISDPHYLTSVSTKKQDDSIAQSIGAQFPGSPVDPSHDPQIPAPPGTAIQLPTLSPGMSPDVSSAVHSVVNNPDSPNIGVSQRDAPPHSKGTTLDSNTPLQNVTYPSEKPSIAPTEFPPLMNIIPTTLILLATLTILFLLYKYTPFGLFLGRRRRKKKDLRTVFEIPEESTYESPNETIHEWDDHLGKQIMENDVYVKLQKINRYKKEMQKKKKKRDTTLIEVHMEILEECKNDEWELYKGDFLEICLQEFINEKNRTEANWPNAELTVNNIKNDKIIQDAEEKEILWNFWMDNYRNILESWKSEEWFQNLKNEWKKERQKNQNKIDKIEENTLKESEMISIECEKDIWKKWILKQATLIEMFKQEDWFKSLIAEQYKEEDNYEINEYINVLNTNMNEFEKGKKYHEFFRKKNIINKLMVQMHMMVLEECKKEEIIENKELCIDNYIQNIHKKNNYDEKSNIP